MTQTRRRHQRGRTARAPRRLPAAASLWLATVALAAASGAEPQRLTDQRAAFRAVWPAVNAGQHAPLDRQRALLSDYPLFPDLLGAYLLADLDARSQPEIEHFVAEYGNLRPGEQLRLRWAHSLARREQWDLFLPIYDTHFADAGDTILDCQAWRARHRTGPSPALDQQALALWLVGRSQPDECDPAFEYLAQRGLLTNELLGERIDLVLAERELGLARYLALKAGPAQRERVERWRRMRADPGHELAMPQAATIAGTDPAWLEFGIARLARRDPTRAARLWQTLEPTLSVTDDTKQRALNDIALWSALDRLPQTDAIMAAIAQPRADVAAWGVRVALLRGDWQRVLAASERLPAEDRAREQWRYWRARALEATGERALAGEAYAALATERSYHGFLAADRIGAPYAFSHSGVVPDEDFLAGLMSDRQVVRALEFRQVGRHADARAEWQRVVTGLDPAGQAQAALLAHRQDWDSRAIDAATRAALWDDLEIRFPTPYAEQFIGNAAARDLNVAWALGIARSESLFAPDVRSSAGALGLMQLMPATGREVARRLGVPYRNDAVLLEPRTNIALGTGHLREVLEQFSGHVVLATAAYNAGARRVSQWLPDSDALPADVWVDTLPFTETRRYVRRVLMAQAIFDWRLNETTARLDRHMREIPPRRP